MLLNAEATTTAQVTVITPNASSTVSIQYQYIQQQHPNVQHHSNNTSEATAFKAQHSSHPSQLKHTRQQTAQNFTVTASTEKTNHSNIIHTIGAHINITLSNSIHSNKINCKQKPLKHKNSAALRATSVTPASIATKKCLAQKWACPKFVSLRKNQKKELR